MIIRERSALLGPIYDVAVGLITRASDGELDDAKAELEAHTNTNCWYIEFWARDFLLRLVNSEIDGRDRAMKFAAMSSRAEGEGHKPCPACNDEGFLHTHEGVVIGPCTECASSQPGDAK